MSLILKKKSYTNLKRNLKIFNNNFIFQNKKVESTSKLLRLKLANFNNK
jgi:hypothetical protein